MKKLFIFLLLFFISSTLVLVHAQTNEEIKAFDDQITVNKDGTVDIKETITYDFGEQSRHGIYRYIPTIKTNQDGKVFKLNFGNFIVTKNISTAEPFKITETEKQIELKIGSADKLITGVNTYTISYVVSGALAYFSDHDEIYWNINGDQWTVPVAEATSTISIPYVISENNTKLACYTGTYGSTEQLCDKEIKNNQIFFKSTNPLTAGSGMSVVVSFPKEIVAVLEPKPYVAFSETLLGKLVGLFLGLLAFSWYFLLPLIIVVIWAVKGRDPKATTPVVRAWFDPPKSPKDGRFLTPGEVGTLGDETVDLKDISGTIIDLARRGFLKIEERSKGDFYFIKQKEYKNTGLLIYEEELLDVFFSSKNEIHLKDQDNFYEKIEEVKKKLYGDVVSIGLFPTNPQSIRTIYYVIAGIAIFTGNIPLAIISFLFGRAMPRKTQEGADCANVAKSLKNFLQSQERQLEFQANKQMMFEKLLPYAIVFGVEKIWAKRFVDLNMRNPSWYQGYGSSNFNTFIFVNSMNSSLKSFQTAATPTRSSSGFSSGFGGGGFSGGGGGGGGGGSW